MQHSDLRQWTSQPLLLVGLLLLFFGFSFSFATAGKHTKPFVSSEVGIATMSPNGPEGGLAIPASAYSTPYAYPYPYPYPYPTPAPTANISQSSGITQQGINFTISWTTNLSINSCGVFREPPGGSFALWQSSTGSGSRTTNEILPLGFYGFYATCTNIAGSATSPTILHNVIPRNPDFSASPLTINEGDPVTINWTCFFSSSSSGVNFSTGGATSGSVVLDPGPSVTTTYSVSCDNGGFGSNTVTVRVPTTGITAAPTLIQPEGTSTITWSASGVNSCTVTGTDGFSASSGNISGGLSWNSSTVAGPLTDQTIYTLSCVTNTGTHVDTVIININPIFEEF